MTFLCCYLVFDGGKLWSQIDQIGYLQREGHGLKYKGFIGLRKRIYYSM